MIASVSPGVSTMAEPSIGALLIKMVLILGVLAAIAWYMRRRAGGSGAPFALSKTTRAKRPSTTSMRSTLRVVSKQTLGKGAYLAVVDWDGHEVLVGITNAGITFYRGDSIVDSLDGGINASIASAAATATRTASTSASTADQDEFASIQGSFSAGTFAARIAGAPEMKTSSSEIARRRISRSSSNAGSPRPTLLEAMRDLTVRR